MIQPYKIPKQTKKRNKILKSRWQKKLRMNDMVIEIKNSVDRINFSLDNNF